MNILFVFAHPDDESFGPAGTIRKLANESHNISILAMCKGNRPGSEHVSLTRQEAFNAVCKVLGATPIIKDCDDTKIDFHQATAIISEAINELKADVVYTHNISDLHRDHRTVAEAAMVVCRPKPESTVKKLLMCEIPASTEWSFNQIEPTFVPNVFVDVTEHMLTKEQVMNWYKTEIYEFPDARSIESMKVIASYRGKQTGVEYAEAFKLVFSKE